jgi:DNA-cytosine methyltransferase
MNVLSLFDGMSCGQIALNRSGIKYDQYFASEIDKHAIQVTLANYPNTVQVGDVTLLKGSALPKIDLLIGGSPCQGFSFAGKQLNFDDPRSKLFFEFVRLLKETNPTWFLLENVLMKKEFQDVISNYMGVEPIMINSNLVSAQNRKRLYWTNIPIKTYPEDKGITWKDVREHNVWLDSMYYSQNALKWLGNHGIRNNKKLKIYDDSDKFPCLEASQHKKYSSQRFFAIIDERPAKIVGRRLNENGTRKDNDPTIVMTQCLEVSSSDKMGCLSTVSKDTVTSTLPSGQYRNVYNELESGKHYRYITPLECERLQTVPDNYTNHVSNSQRYKMLGNGWTVDVICHILSFIDPNRQINLNEQPIERLSTYKATIF